jgi:hypothetical protein
MCATEAVAVRPFRVEFPKAELAELRRRIEATRWPERETVTDDSQGVPLATMQELARYWATDYDWVPCQAKLNALPHFVTEIDGLDIHFIHVRSRHEGALPLRDQRRSGRAVSSTAHLGGAGRRGGGMIERPVVSPGSEILEISNDDRKAWS